MHVDNLKFFNDFNNIIQTSDAYRCNSTYTNVRKRALDGFHKELKKRIDCSNPTDPRYAAIFTSDFYPFHETSSGMSLSNESGFKSFDGLKFRIDEYMTEIDLQLFSTIPWDILCYDKNCELLSHREIPEKTKGQFFNRYEENRNERFSNLLYHLKNRLPTIVDGNKPEDISVIFVNYFEHIKASGILEQRRDELHKAQCNYIPWNPIIDEDYIITEKAIEERDRPFDCFLGGLAIPFVYPYRYLAFEKIKKMGNELKIVPENRIAHNEKYQEGLTLYENGYITKTQLDIRTDLLGRMQYEEYLDRASSSKVAVACSSVFGFPLKKYFEYMARGCVVVGNLPKYAKEYGIVHMENAIECDVDDIEDAVKLVLNNNDLRIKLAKNGLKLVRDRYTPKQQVDNLMYNLNQISLQYK
jgi:glycosyltransferase involved in cell wall biosynthesis